MGFTYNDTSSADMGLKARLTSWQVCGNLRNYTASIPGKSGIADFGADFDYREINVSCSIPPKRTFAALVSVLDDIALWLDPADGLKQLIFDDVPDRYRRFSDGTGHCTATSHNHLGYRKAALCRSQPAETDGQHWLSAQNNLCLLPRKTSLDRLPSVRLHSGSSKCDGSTMPNTLPTIERDKNLRNTYLGYHIFLGSRENVR